MSKITAVTTQIKLPRSSRNNVKVLWIGSILPVSPDRKSLRIRRAAQDWRRDV